MALAALSVVCLATPSCVIPIAPEFEDEANLPPFVVSAMPPEGSIVTPAEGEPRFSVTVEDPNLRDRLYVRWLIDYPPYDNTSRVDEYPDLPARSPNQHPLSFAPSCTHHTISPSLSRHRLMLAVSDRGFIDFDDPSLSPEERLDAPKPGAHVLRVVWQFNKDCVR